MLGTFQATLWSRTKAARLQPWSLDRNWDRTEGERLLKALDFAGAETHLTRAAIDAEQRGHTAPKRIQVRLLLAEAQRKQFRGPLGENPEKLTAAEMTVRAAIEKLTPPSENDTATYLKRLEGAGVDLDKTVQSQIDTLMSAVEANEGMIAGTEITRSS